MRFFLTIILVVFCATAHAETADRLNDMISRGNRAYDLSQPSHIKECADSASMLLATGGLSLNDSIDFLASIYKLYGNFHYEKSDFDMAEAYYEKAGKLMDSHPHVAFKSLTKLLVLRDKVQLYYRLERYPEAAELMALADDEIEYRAPYEVGSDEWLITKLTYAICLARIKDFDAATSIARTELSNATDKTSLSYAKAERMYAKILMLAEADRAGALRAYRHYFEKQRAEAMANLGMMDSGQRQEYWQTLRPFIADCYRLEDIDPGFLYDVTLFSKGLLLHLDRLSGNDVASKAAVSTLSYGWKDIQKRLKPKQAAIEFIQYEKDGESRMAALILKSSGSPAFVALTPPDEVLSFSGKEMQSTDRSGKDRLYNDPEMQKLIWTESLLNALAGIRRIYFAPDGYLHRLAIEYLPAVEPYELYRLTSTRRLMEKPSQLAADAPALFIGGINYDLDKAPGDSADNDVSAYRNYIGKSFPRLSDFSNEARTIYDFRGNSRDTLVMASNASEAVFKQIAPGYPSILVSTHGDFCNSQPIPTDIKTLSGNETMSENIIAFAGVNSYLHDRDFTAENHYDGLLSAREIAQLDLRECVLFTISACQSALGHISSDGVFGLQRGLKNSGVDVMLLSLWNVNSEATSQLMKYFYSHLRDGRGIGAAFALARKDLMNKPVEVGDAVTSFVFDPATMASVPVQSLETKSFNMPQYVDAFILIDAIE